MCPKIPARSLPVAYDSIDGCTSKIDYPELPFVTKGTEYAFVIYRNSPLRKVDLHADAARMLQVLLQGLEAWTGPISTQDAHIVLHRQPPPRFGDNLSAGEPDLEVLFVACCAHTCAAVAYPNTKGVASLHWCKPDLRVITNNCRCTGHAIQL